MKSAALLLVLVPVYSLLDVSCVNAQTAWNMQVQSELTTTTMQPPARHGADFAQAHFYPACQGIGVRTSLPQTSLSSVDISVAEYDPPLPPITDITVTREVGNGQRGPRGVRGLYP